MWDRIWINANLATMIPDAASPYGEVHDAALAVTGGRISWLGPSDALPGAPAELASSVEDAGGCWLLPGLIDCHTHLVFGGNRAAEFEQRLGGASYTQIAAAGGGIASTVRATRGATAAELAQASLARLLALQASGVTTVEIKSGYGLDYAAEASMLQAAMQLTLETPLRIEKTFLGLHALPEAFKHRRAAYVTEVCEVTLPQIAEAGLASAVDAFCESMAFTPAEVRQFFTAAHDLGLPVKLHADQLSDLGGAALAADFSALSADHLEYTNEAGVGAMAAAGSVAVLLPGAFYSLGETRKPPIESFRDRGVAMAVASDLNPGTSPLCSAPLAMNMACTLFGLTPAEALAGMTTHAAKALGLGDQIGTLATGKAADLTIWRVDQPAEICYWIGLAGPDRVVIAGQTVSG